jgi:hypothetical protein
MEHPQQYIPRLTITNNLPIAPRLLAFENSMPTANASTHLWPTIFVYKKKNYSVQKAQQ